MIETDIAIKINRKSDIELIEEKIIQNKIHFPVYISEYEFNYQINFTSDYEEWELDTSILHCFPGYEYTTDLERGQKEIRIQISRYQSGLSTDDWGRQIENPLNETKYLVKKSIIKPVKFSPRIKVLFGNNEKYYHVNIIGGINKTNGEEGFLLLNDFKSDNKDTNTAILKDRMYPSPIEAFHSGYQKIREIAQIDFDLYLEQQKKEIRIEQKIPRKIVRDFIKACNNSDENEIFKNLDENIAFEKLKNWKSIYRTDGTVALKEYLKSTEQQLVGKNFTIRSSWYFNMPVITIGVKFFPTADDQKTSRFQKYLQLKFILEDNKIISITEES